MNKKFLQQIIYNFFLESDDSYKKNKMLILIRDIDKIPSDIIEVESDEINQYLTVRQIKMIETMLKYMERDNPFEYSRI